MPFLDQCRIHQGFVGNHCVMALSAKVILRISDMVSKF
uniref:Uncharacterized protein n=1 Tax=Lepeophtheirus salmonis TaxID=72036 RepID=A0A0K2V8Q2_LEPSM